MNKLTPSIILLENEYICVHYAICAMQSKKSGQINQDWLKSLETTTIFKTWLKTK